MMNDDEIRHEFNGLYGIPTYEALKRVAATAEITVDEVRESLARTAFDTDETKRDS